MITGNQTRIKKAVVLVDKFGEVIDEFPSIEEASKQIGISKHSISKACHKLIPLENDKYFIFFKKDYCSGTFEYAYKQMEQKNYKVMVIDDKGREQYYNSFEQCAKDLGVSATSINSWCQGKKILQDNIVNIGLLKKMIRK